ncbi:heme-dependent oxidative N-demethylase family protein [Roseimaritima ulvae]|uniref:DUF3445 domain-containing protein n=1 Tax=Roseimaritima ulvae TaxID=980254 RepID=A0A5B9QWK3_9BACT|nr:DUF3445 domain-containing protein [Roseimaritima ulvae]QEG42372.1 hypothetical protein UC8_44060 [Roseimaritima ulvae]
MRYFPLTSDRFQHDFGVRALPAEQSVIEVTELYEEQIQQRRRLLRDDRDAYYRGDDASLPDQHEAFEWIAGQAPLPEFPQLDLLALEDEPPLLLAGQHVQEDLVLMRDDFAAGYPIVAGVVCFPSGWCIADKMGKNVWDVHQPVPEFAELAATKTVKLLRGLKTLRPVWRMNWGVRSSGELDQSPQQLARHASPAVTINAGNAGQQCWFRVERQTLTRLPGGAILFTIHTHQASVETLTTEQRAMLGGTIASCPEATLRYKGIWPFHAALLEYLG